MNSGSALSARSRLDSRLAGYSMLEILFVVALLGIILAYAIPAYRQYVQRVHRADAVRTLLSIAGCQERVRAQSGFYDTTRCLEAPDQADYAISLEPAENPSSLVFQAIATPLHRDPNDFCGALMINQTGTRQVSGDAQKKADCWGGR